MPLPCGRTFDFAFDGQDIFDAYTELEPGLGKYAVVRIWEVKLMVELKIVDEDQYTSIPIKTRARMIAAQQGPAMVAALDQDRQYKKMRKESYKR